MKQTWHFPGISRKVITRALSLCLLALLAGTLIWHAGDTPAGAQSPPGEILLHQSDQGTLVELSEEQLLTITLPGNPSTGYQWQIAQIDKRLLTQVGEVEFENQSELIGAPAMMTLRFAGLSAGESQLKLVYRRPWESTQPDAPEFVIRLRTVGAYSLKNLPAKSAPRQVDASPAMPQAISQPEETSTLPGYFNWCDLGACTPMRNQGGCGSCWAFATVAPLESMIKLNTGVSKNLSEQYLLSCNSNGYTCQGGWWVHDYHWWKKIDTEPDAGAVYEADFPYVASDVSCNSPYTHHEKISGWSYVAGYSLPSVAALKQAIYDHGPLAVTVCVNNDFHNYSGGVFTGQSCTSINHGVALVGWDDSKGSSGAWRLRNSWGTGWGESGYMWIGYGVSQVGYAATYIHYAMPLTAPSNLIAAARTRSEISLAWSDSNTSESGFHIERSPNGSSGWSRVASTGPDVTGYIDSGLASGAPYYYRVQAYSGSATTGYSNIASASPFTQAEFIPSFLNTTPPTSFGIPLQEGFEGGVVPPAGWTRLQTNSRQSWKVLSDSAQDGSYAAQVEYDDWLGEQDEVLLSPQFQINAAMLQFYSFSSLYWCRDTYDDCDLNVWLVFGDWGGDDDILLAVADNDWTASYTWSLSQINLTPYLNSAVPVRVAFQYLGMDGAQIGLDAISIEGPR